MTPHAPLLVVLALGAGAALAQPAAAPAGGAGLCTPDRPISRIEIERVNVFDLRGDHDHLRGLYKAANLLHRPMLTRARTIRALLSIREGEPCTIDALEEAERILRGYVFVQDAWVEPVGLEEDGVVVRVRVQDTWSTRVRLSARSQGGASRTSFGLREVNLLGTGSQLQWTSSRDQDRSRTTFTFVDPSLGRSKWRLLAIYSNNSDGLQRSFSAGKPFYEFADRWQFLVGADSGVREEKVYVGDRIVDRWERNETDLRLAFGWAPRGLRGDRLSRWSFRAGLRELRWRPADPARGVARPDLQPLDRDLIWLGAGREWRVIDFRRVHLIDTGRRVEDLDLSRRFAVDLELGAGRAGAPGGARLTLGASDGFDLGGDTYLLLAASHSIERVGARNVDAVTTFGGRLVTKPSHLTAVNLELDARDGHALEGPERFLAGGDTGLRGYPSRAFSGERFLLARAELRYFAPWYLGKLLRFGAVGFAELGGAWDPPRRVGRAVLHPDVGLGLRGYIRPSSGGTTLHFNVAYPLDREVGGRRFGVQFSFLAARTF